MVGQAVGSSRSGGVLVRDPRTGAIRDVRDASVEGPQDEQRTQYRLRGGGGKSKPVTTQEAVEEQQSVDPEVERQRRQREILANAKLSLQERQKMINQEINKFNTKYSQVANKKQAGTTFRRDLDTINRNINKYNKDFETYSRNTNFLYNYQQATTKPSVSSNINPQTNKPYGVVKPFPSVSERFKESLKDREPVSATIMFASQEVRRKLAPFERKIFPRGEGKGQGQLLLSSESGPGIDQLTQASIYFNPVTGPAITGASALGLLTPGGIKEAKRIGEVVESETGLKKRDVILGVYLLAATGTGLQARNIIKPVTGIATGAATAAEKAASLTLKNKFSQRFQQISQELSLPKATKFGYLGRAEQTSSQIIREIPSTQFGVIGKPSGPIQRIMNKPLTNQGLIGQAPLTRVQYLRTIQATNAGLIGKPALSQVQKFAVKNALSNEGFIGARPLSAVERFSQSNRITNEGFIGRPPLSRIQRFARTPSTTEGFIGPDVNAIGRRIDNEAMLSNAELIYRKLDTVLPKERFRIFIEAEKARAAIRERNIELALANKNMISQARFKYGTGPYTASGLFPNEKSFVRQRAEQFLFNAQSRAVIQSQFIRSSIGSTASKTGLFLRTKAQPIQSRINSILERKEGLKRLNQLELSQAMQRYGNIGEPTLFKRYISSVKKEVERQRFIDYQIKMRSSVRTSPYFPVESNVMSPIKRSTTPSIKEIVNPKTGLVQLQELEQPLIVGGLGREASEFVAKGVYEKTAFNVLSSFKQQPQLLTATTSNSVQLKKDVDIGVRPAEIEKSFEKPFVTNKIRDLIRSRDRTASKNQQQERLVPKEDTLPRLSLIPGQRFSSNVRNRLRTTNLLKPNTMLNNKKRMPPKLLKISRSITQERIASPLPSSNKAFDVITFRGGKEVVIGENLPKGRALRLGETTTKQTLRASFKLRESGSTTLPDVPFRVDPKVFRPGKRDPSRFVQRSKFRLSARSEVGEIQRSRRRRLL